MTKSYEEARAIVEARLESLNSYNAMLAQFDMQGTERELSIPVASLRALLAGPSEREGWVLVPREPTENMAVTFLDAEEASPMIDPLGAFQDAWTAMLTATPKP